VEQKWIKNKTNILFGGKNMAIITFDRNNNLVSVLVEKTDMIHDKKDGAISISNADKSYRTGEVIINGDIQLCMVRGER